MTRADSRTDIPRCGGEAMLLWLLADSIAVNSFYIQETELDKANKDTMQSAML